MTNVGDTFEAIVAGADIDAEEHENNYSRISDFFSGLVADANITLTGSITGETLSDGTASITGGVGTGFSSITSTLFTGALTGNVTGNVSGSSGSCSGLSATATALATARNIAGVAFDGTANISLNNNAITNGAGYTTNVGDLVSGGALGTPSSGTLTNCTFPTLNQNTTGQAGTVATIAGLAPDTATTQATQPNVTSIANLATVGTITTGVWNAGAVTSSGGISGTTGTFSDDVGITGKISLNDGGSSVFVGEGAGLNDDGTDNRNVGVGHYSLLSNTTGSNNTASGYQAGRYIADGTTANETGTYNTFIGYNTKALADGDTNETVIGNGAVGAGSNTVTLGNDDITDTYLKGDVSVGGDLTVGGDVSVSGGISATTGTFSGGISGTIVREAVTTIVSSATPTINSDNCAYVTITALATNITSMTTNLSGTPTNFQKLIFRIKDNGTSRSITWGSDFEAKGVALPTATTASKVLATGFIYDTVTSKWGCVASVEES